MRCDRLLEVQLKHLAKICQSFFFSVALAGNIRLQALRNKPIALAPDRSRKWAFHIPICHTSEASPAPVR